MCVLLRKVALPVRAWGAVRDTFEIVAAAMLRPRPRALSSVLPLHPATQRPPCPLAPRGRSAPDVETGLVPVPAVAAAPGAGPGDAGTDARFRSSPGSAGASVAALSATSTAAAVSTDTVSANSEAAATSADSVADASGAVNSSITSAGTLGLDRLNRGGFSRSGHLVRRRGWRLVRNNLGH